MASSKLVKVKMGSSGQNLLLHQSRFQPGLSDKAQSDKTFFSRYFSAKNHFPVMKHIAQTVEMPGVDDAAKVATLLKVGSKKSVIHAFIAAISSFSTFL